MKRECFICGRESYEFESQAKVGHQCAWNSSYQQQLAQLTKNGRKNHGRFVFRYSDIIFQ